jgi:class 3 adenylate cyclase
MPMEDCVGGVRYTPPPATTAWPERYFVFGAGASEERRFTFYDRIEFGRDRGDGSVPAPGTMMVRDDVVSRRHCVVTQTQSGQCMVRDLSRNGTRIDGRRLIPNLESEISVGQILTVGLNHEFVLAPAAAAPVKIESLELDRTTGVQGHTVATVLVGDIRDYTVLVRAAESAALQQSVSRVFEGLAEVVEQFGGAIKEYQGDALFAFWEGALDPGQVAKACSAALALHELSRRMADDPRIWKLPKFPLHLDWALATGPVVIDSFGGRMPTGLSMIGEAVVKAFRIEKFANDDTGPIVACPVTRNIASDLFTFRDLGEFHAKGFDKPDKVFAVSGAVELSEDGERTRLHKPAPPPNPMHPNGNRTAGG